MNDEQGQNVAEKSKTHVGGKSNRGFGKQRRERNTKESFFLWFSNEAAFDENMMVDVIRELYQFPLSYYSLEDDEEQEGENGSMMPLRQSGKSAGSKIGRDVGNGEEEDDDEDEPEDDDEDAYDEVEFNQEGDEEEEGEADNANAVSPMLGTDDIDDDGDDGEVGDFRNDDVGDGADDDK